MPKISLLHSSYAELAEHVPPATADGLLADMGISSMQLATQHADSVFRRKGRSTCEWTRKESAPPIKW